MRRTTIAVLLVTALMTLTAPVLAGGWATVRLDKPVVGDIPVNKPWRFSFMVLQHDVMPNSDVTPTVRAIHRETGREVTATAVQEGGVGHFVAELTLPLTGEWKWEIQPEPYAETTFEALTVVDPLSVLTPLYQAGIHPGACHQLSDVTFSLGDLDLQPVNVKSAQLPVAIGAATVDAPLSELLRTGHAISVAMNGGDLPLPVACGEIVDLSGASGADRTELVLGLHAWDEARNVGLAVLRSQAERTAVSLYLLDFGGPGDVPVTGPTATVEIVGGEADMMAFQPATATVAAGDTITWVNTSDIAHTITGDDLAFADSGPLDPGQSFSQTFPEPGTYRYRCGPHPWMEGMIVVT
jgi:plastocyanin